MADNGHPNTVDLLEHGTNLVNAPEIITVASSNVTGTVEVSEDILQQAFREASHQFAGTGASYAEGQVPVADATNDLSIPDGGIVSAIGDSDVIYTLGGSGEGTPQTVESLLGLGTHQIVEQVDEHGEVTQFLRQIQNSSGVMEAITGHIPGSIQAQVSNAIATEVTSSLENNAQVKNESIQESSLQEGQQCLALQGDSLVALSQQPDTAALTSVADSATNSEQLAPHPSITVLTNSVSGTTTATGLGSSQNPIRIVQQGNQYTSLQQLTPDQLSQIMQVVQQQQLKRATQKAGTTSVLYNPQTQTKIVYKVIHPSDLHKKGNSDAPTSTPSRLSASTSSDGKRTITVPASMLTLPVRRPYRKRKLDETDKSTSGPDLSKEEKEQRKKARLRTRSGRISRPPKHMVKDYKHIHPVDWEEEYDDSDGGYSDFKLSEDEDGNIHRRRRDSSYSPFGLLGNSDITHMILGRFLICVQSLVIW